MALQPLHDAFHGKRRELVNCNSLRCPHWACPDSLLRSACNSVIAPIFRGFNRLARGIKRSIDDAEREAREIVRDIQNLPEELESFLNAQLRE